MDQKILLLAIEKNVSLQFIPRADGLFQIVATNLKNFQIDSKCIPKEVLELAANIQGSVIKDTITMLINSVSKEPQPILCKHEGCSNRPTHGGYCAAHCSCLE